MAFCSVSEILGHSSGPQSSSTNRACEFVDRELFEVRVGVTTADEFAADLPQVAQIAIEGRFGGLAAQQVEQERT